MPVLIPPSGIYGIVCGSPRADGGPGGSLKLTSVGLNNICTIDLEEVEVVDHAGLDKMDHKLLLTLIDQFNGGPVGVESLAASIHEERETIEDVYEPYLLQQGFLHRTPRGRVATPSAFEHFGKTQPKRDSQGSLF